MRLLFSIDLQDYADCTRVFRRDSARGVILRSGRVAMLHSLRDGYYKFPGGGIEKDERPEEAMIRETREEAGLIVKTETVREYGYVHRIQRGGQDPQECFVQDNFYYLCETEDEMCSPQMEDYEAEAGFTLEFVDARHAICANRKVAAESRYQTMILREARVLEMLIEEGVIP
ncbi:MAG: NUDIX domain-containing protein [Clostridia bacterium]|nr:NUDIX domain-containing protein [Clostridia bacterium]